MSDSENKPTLGRKPLGLKTSVQAGEVKQTFSHGRTNKVVVEVKRRKLIGKPGEVAAPAPVAPPPPPPPVVEAPKPAPKPSSAAESRQQSQRLQRQKRGRIEHYFGGTACDMVFGLLFFVRSASCIHALDGGARDAHPHVDYRTPQNRC